MAQHDSASQQTLIDLNYGKLRNQVVKITKPGGKYEVRTPNAVVGVIGTYFFVSYKNGRTVIICYDGTLSVTPVAGAKIVASNNSSTGSENPVTVAAGQVVVIGSKIEENTIPSFPALQRSSLKDTEVDEMKNPHHARTWTLISMGVVAGLAFGITQAKSSNRPCGCK